MQPLNPQAPLNATTLNPGDLVNEVEAAAILKTAVRTLRNWRALRTGPKFRKVGLRMVRYHRADLTAFIDGDAATDAET